MESGGVAALCGGGMRTGGGQALRHIEQLQADEQPIAVGDAPDVTDNGLRIVLGRVRTLGRDGGA